MHISTIRPRNLAFVSAFLLVVAACGGSATTTTVATTTSAPEAPATTTTSTVAPETTTSTAPAPTTTSAPTLEDELNEITWIYTDPDTIAAVVLIDPGSEPRAVRAWSPQPGTRFAMTMTTATALDQTLNGLNQVINLGLEMVSTSEVLAVTDEGTISRGTFDTPIVTTDDPAQQAAIEEGVASLSDVVLYQLTSPNGTIIATSELGALPGSEFLPTSLGGVTAGFPDEPIGLGAVWEVRGTLDSAGLAFEQTTTVTVVDIVGDQLFVELVIDQQIDPDSPGLIGIDEFSIESENTGEAVWDLGVGYPISASSVGVQDLAFTLIVGNETQALVQRTTVTVSMAVASLE